MTIQECYQKIGGDYEAVLKRLMSPNLVRKFIGKFLEDDSYQKLCEEMDAGNREEAFRAAHTLKGVCLNLGLKNLYTVSSDLTEKLRGRELDGSDELFQKVREQYNITIDALKKVE